MVEVMSSQKPERLHGLDFARFLAFAGMVFVNFHVVTGLGNGAPWATGFLTMLEGKAAATFVVLAGVGFGLGYSRGMARNKGANFNFTIMKRALFLLVIGLLNSLIFPADILHYYAIYFIFGLLLVRVSSLVIVLVGMALPLVFVLLLGVVDYEAGWNWQTFEYADFWTPEGFARNLMYNGWHPVVPWLSFLLFGVLLSRLNLAARGIHIRLMIYGTGALVLAYGLAFLMSGLDPELAELASVSPIPPLPLYMIAGSGAAALVIGVSLNLFSGGMIKSLAPFTKTGKQALTLYIGHIVIGMGVLEAFGFIGGQTAQFSIFAASLFILFAIIYATLWARYFKAGPIEWLMRRVAG